jgi:hypothetical protein
MWGSCSYSTAKLRELFQLKMLGCDQHLSSLFRDANAKGFEEFYFIIYGHSRRPCTCSFPDAKLELRIQECIVASVGRVQMLACWAICSNVLIFSGDPPAPQSQPEAPTRLQMQILHLSQFRPHFLRCQVQIRRMKTHQCYVIAKSAAWPVVVT